MISLNRRSSQVTILFLSLFVLCYLLLKFALPLYAKSKISNIFSKQTGLILKIEKLDFEPFGLQVDFEGLSFSRKHLIKSLSIDLSIENILNKRIVISELDIAGIELKILKKNNNFTIESFKTKTNQDTKEDIDVSSGQVEWGFSVTKLNVIDSKISFLEGPTLNIDKLHISDLFSFDSAQKTNFESRLSLNDSVVEIKGFAQSYLSSMFAEAKLDLKDMELSSLNYFLSDYFGKVEGLLGLKSKIVINNNKSEIYSDLELSNFKIFSKNLKIVEYYIQNLKLVESAIHFDNDYFKFNARKAHFGRPILSIPIKRLNKKKRKSLHSQIELSDISLIKPRQDNYGDKEMSFSATYNQSGKIKVNEFFRKDVRILNAKILNIDLLPLSETFQETLGYQIDTGKLNLNIDLSTINHKQNGKALITLNQLRLDNENEVGERIENNLNFPLKTAISLIRDDEGSIDLEVDISGNENNPEFGFLPLLRNGLGSIVLSKLGTLIVTKAATNFLPLLVSSIPFSPGNFLLLANGSYKFLTKPRFQNIEFKPNSDTIAKDSLLVLAELKSFLLKNREINFTLCPIASSNESNQDGVSHTYQEDEILSLADLRIRKVKSEFSDSPSTLRQLIFCRPKIVETKTEIGILEISL